MYVTCLCDVYNKPEKLEEYIKLFQPLAESGLHIHLYTSPEIAHHFKDYPDTVQVLEVPLAHCEIWNLIMRSNPTLPAEANPTKDTKEYLALMNSKIDFLQHSSEISDDKNLIWIDFAILKIFKDIPRCIQYLKDFADMDFDKINIPGCWYKGEALYLNAINWRFCGGFFVIPRIHFKRFYKDCYESLRDFLTQDGIITWEVNVWYHVEYYKGKDYIKWYYALHDDGMLWALVENIDPWTGQKI
jgi:hypothetical protein